jgi:hypothetical protein
MISLTIYSLAMVNFTIITLIILNLAIIISFLFILIKMNFCIISFAIEYIFIN